MRGFQPAAHLVPKYADGGLVQRALGLFGGRKKQIDEAVKVASQDTRQASAPAPAPVKTTPDGKFDEKRASKDNPAGIGFADGGMVSGGEFVNPLAGIGDYWSKSNAEFEAQGPSLTQRALRAINPVTGLGSAVGAMHDGASKGSAVDMSIAALQATPVFGAMRAVAPAVKSAIGAVPAAMAPSAAGTAARAAKNVAAGVVADEAQEGNYFNGFADGGLVRGPGTGTSDDVPDKVPEGTYIMPADSTEAIGPENLARAGARGLPMPGGKKVDVRLSNGEFKLPPEQVHAVGVQALEQAKKATHTPVARGLPMPKQGKEPPLFFADGGLVDEEEKRNGAAMPAAPTPPATGAQVQGLYQDWQDKKTPWYMPTPKGNMEERTAEAAYTKALAGSYAGGGLQHQPGAQPPSSPAPTPTQDAAPPVATPATATLNSTLEAQRRRDAIAGKNTDQNTTPQPSNTPSPEAQATQGREVVPGAYAHGRGQYSDQAGGMGFSAGFTGKPNSQNDAAAEALAARSQQESLARLAAEQYRQEVADAQAINAAGTQYAPNSGLQYQWMKDIRDPRTMALRNASVGSTIFRNKGEEMTANKARQARVASVQGAINAQMHDAQQADTARYQSDNTLAGNIATEQMRQASENQRSARGFAVDQQRLGIEAGKAAQESTARGFDIRAAQRREGVLQRYDAAKTDQERVQLQRQYPDVFGRQESANRFTVVPGGQEWDAAAGAMRNVPGRVLNNQTGQFVEQGAQTAAAPKVGETRNGYRYKGGDPNDQASWQQI